MRRCIPTAMPPRAGEPARLSHRFGARLRLATAFLLALTAATGSAQPEPPVAKFQTRQASFTVDTRGSLTAVTANASGRNYLAPGQPAPLLSVRLAGRLHHPESAAWDAGTGRLSLRFAELGMLAVLKAEAKPTHVVFELFDLQPTNGVELVLWGPYPTSIGGIIGETVGVVRTAEFAIGLQALNAKTLGGYPTRENDIEADYTADDPATYPDLPAELRKDQLFRGDTARRTDYGSVLQAFCRNRDHDRVIANWGHEQFVAPAFNLNSAIEGMGKVGLRQ